MRHRLISYVDALFVGIVLGLLFVTFVHASPQTGQGRAHQWTIVCGHIRDFGH